MRYRYEDEEYEDDSDILLEVAVANGTEQEDGTLTCDLCGETFVDWSDLGMHIGYGHHLITMIPETEKEAQGIKTFRGIPDDLPGNEMFR